MTPPRLLHSESDSVLCWLTGSTKEEGESPDEASAYFFGENTPAVADKLAKFLIM